MNGQFTIDIDIGERGLAFGDGHFTTAKIVSGQVEFFDEHIQRLTSAHKTLNLPPVNMAEISAHIQDQVQPFELAVLKVMITAGSGGRGYSRKGIERSNYFVTISEYPEHYKQWQQQGITVGVAKNCLSIHPVLSGIKHLNRLEQVMIRVELDEREEDDLVVLDTQGMVTESSCGNLFWLKQGQWFTPSLSQSGIAGIMRNHILTRLSVSETRCHLDALKDAEAMFISNALMGMVPVNCFNNKALDISAVHEVEEFVKG